MIQGSGRSLDEHATPYELTDFEWSVIQPLLPNKPRGVPRAEDRKVLNGIYWRLRTGSPWADIPERYGPPTTCYNRFVRWSAKGVWTSIFHALARAGGPPAQVLLDRTVKAHRCARWRKTYGPPRPQVARFAEQSAETYPAFPPRRLAKMEIRAF